MLVLSAVLMLGSPALAHELSGSTCAADVVFLWDKKHFASCGLHGGSVETPEDRLGTSRHGNNGYCGGAASMRLASDDELLTGAADKYGRVAVGKRPPLLYGHTKAVIDALSAKGADVRFGTAEQSIDPAVSLAVGNYGNVVYGDMRRGDFSGTEREGRERIAHAEEIEQQLFAAQTIDSQVFRYHNPKGLSAAEHNTAGSKFGNPDHLFGSGYGREGRFGIARPPTAAQVATDTDLFTETEFGRAGPNGIAFDSKGNVYVLNAGRNEVYKMSHLGAVMAKWGGHGSGPGQFAHMAKHGGMMGIAIGPNHNVFITDQGNFRVQVFAQDGTFRSEFGTKGKGNGQFLKPTHVAADSKGNVYVTDWERRDIQKFVPEIVPPRPGTPYKWSLTFGGKETKDYEQGRFYKKADAYGPNGIAVNSKDQIHVSDSGNCRVQVFDSDGKFKHQIPSAPHTPVLNLTGIRAQKAFWEGQPSYGQQILMSCAYDRDGNYRPHPHRSRDQFHSKVAWPPGSPSGYYPKCSGAGKWGSGSWRATVTEPCGYEGRWSNEYKYIPARDPTAPLLDPSQKCRGGDGTFYDNPTEYITEYLKSKLRAHYLNRDKVGASRSPTGTYGFSEEHIAAVFPAGAGASASAATGPVDVCNNLAVSSIKNITAYDVSVNFRAQHPVAWKYSRSAQPEYPASKWPGPGAIAIGKDDALFVVDGPAIGIKGTSHLGRRPTQMLIKQFSAAGEFLGTVAGAGEHIADLPALAIRRPKSSAEDAEFGTVTMNTSFKKDVMDTAFNVTQKLTANKAEALKAVATGVTPNNLGDGTFFGLGGDTTATTYISRNRSGDLFALHQLATSGGPTPKYRTGTGKAPGWRTGEDVARIIVWYGDRAAGTESANIDEVITELQNNDITVIAVNTKYGADRGDLGGYVKGAQGRFSATMLDAPGFGEGRGRGLDCPELTRLTLKAAPMLATEFAPREVAHLPVSTDNQKRAPCHITKVPREITVVRYGKEDPRTLSVPKSDAIKIYTKAGGPTGYLCVDGCSASQDGDGQATRIIDATGGAYQHLLEGDLINGAWRKLWDTHGRASHKGKKMADGSCKSCAGGAEAWNGGKGNYEPTVKFILDQFNPPPMAGSSVPVTVSNDRKTLYVAKFDDGKATGDLEAWSLSAAYIPTSIKWSSAKKLDARSRLASTRNALTYSEGRGVRMEWNRLSVEQKADFLAGRSAESKDQARLKFLLGDRSKEGSEFHQRSSVLGPIARSAPVYVGKPNQKWLASAGGSAYAAFLKQAAKRNAMVYVGSNGGALHGFDAVSGEETLAYYPGALYRTGHGGYHDLALAGFKHKTKYVDGVPSVSDAKVGGKWKTVLVSSLGGGGRGLFALDVTDPSELSDAGKTVLWEFTHKDDPHLGYTHSKPILTQMNNGKWAAIIGNGQDADADDATAGQAQLFIVYLDGPGGDGVWDLGKDYLRISTGEGTVDTALSAAADAAAAAADDAAAAAKGTPDDSAAFAAAAVATVAAADAAAAAAASRNALFAPIGIDTVIPQDGKVDVIYAGDLYGNLWRFDVTGSSSWSGPVKPLFKGDKTRPITAIPAVGAAPASVTDLAPIRTGALAKTHSVMVFFGSGRLLADANKGASIVNRFYGVYDDGSKLGLTEADLTVQKLVYSTANGRVYKNDLNVGYSRSVSSSKRGWYITLPDDGERVIDRALVKGELVYFNTILPDTSTCDAGGKGWEMVVQMSNGGSAKGAQWDYNQNGSLDAGDMHAGLSYAGRKTAKGQPGAPQIIGNQLFSPLTDKVGTAKGGSAHWVSGEPVINTKIASAGTSGRISWIELQLKETD